MSMIVVIPPQTAAVDPVPKFLLVGHPRVAEMHVRIDEAGENMLSRQVYHRLALRQGLISSDGDEFAVGDRNPAAHRFLRGDHPAVLQNQIRRHENLLAVLPLLI